MRQLPAEIISILLIFVNFVAAQSSASASELPCTGTYEPLNVDGQSPEVLYSLLRVPCLHNVPPNAIPCQCNLLVYNVFSATAACHSNEMLPWSQYAQNNQCNASAPPPSYPYNTQNFTIPKYASLQLSNGMFDVNGALSKSTSWSPIQIALPVVVGLVVALLAATLFFFYRRRHRGDLRKRKRGQKPWQSAHLHGPRRFFGLVPDRSTVRPRGSREPQWEIDDDAPLELEDDFGRHRRSLSPKSRHSRGDSTSSLLTTSDSRHSARPKSFLQTVASRISQLSLGKKYQSGAAKGRDFKRVRVVSGSIDPKFKIDGADIPTPVPAPRPDEHFPRDGPPERQFSLPTVIEIGPSAAAGSSQARATRNDSLPTTDYAPPTIIHSDFSLGTADLVTPPLSPSTYDAVEQLPNPSVVPHGNVVSSASPLLNSSRNGPLPPLRGAPLYIERQESTDSLAHELYPRGPAYEY